MQKPFFIFVFGFEFESETIFRFPHSIVLMDKLLTRQILLCLEPID